MLKPSGRMFSTRIMMRPMDYTALLTPLIFPIEDDRVSYSQGTDSWGNVNVVRKQQSLPGPQLDDKPLMFSSLIVVGQ
ncbi:MAG: hypothetical protein WC637_19045 [Victivallales bacterium]